MPAFNRVTPAAAESIPALSHRFAFRCVLCLVLTAFNVGVIASFGVSLYHAAAGHPVQLAGVTLIFALLLGSLVNVWTAALRTRALS